MGTEREIGKLEIYLGDKINRRDDGLDVRVRMREVSRLILKFLARLAGWMEAPFLGERVDFREKNKSSVWDILSLRCL